MHKVILHNFTTPYMQPRGGVFNFDCLGALFADPGDIVVTRQTCPPYLRTFFEELGIFSTDVSFFSPTSFVPNTHDAVFEDQGLKQTLRDRIDRCSNTTRLDAYIVTEHEHKWATEVGLEVVENPGLTRTMGSKSAFRTYARDLGVRIPPGAEYIAGRVSLLLKAAPLFLSGFSNVVAKHDMGSAGLGSYRFSVRGLLREMKQDATLFESLQPVLNLESARTWVVEAWHADVAFSPSIQFHLSSDGGAQLLSEHVQLFYENKMTYRGCMSAQWIPSDVRSRLSSEGTVLANRYAERGYRGHLTFNAIVLHSGDLLWVEANPRRVMSSYAHQLARRIASGRDLAYASYEYRHNHLQVRAPETLQERFREFNIMCRNSTGGVVPYDFTLLESEGKLRVLFYDISTSSVEALIRDFDRYLAHGLKFGN